MFSGDKKYTIEEFKVLFDKAEKLTIEELEKDMRKSKEQSGRDSDDFGVMMFTMQNMLAIGVLRKNLFQEEK